MIGMHCMTDEVDAATVSAAGVPQATSPLEPSEVSPSPSRMKRLEGYIGDYERTSKVRCQTIYYPNSMA